jgi:hypothetical protein
LDPERWYLAKTSLQALLKKLKWGTRITQPKTHGKHQHKIRIPRTLSLTIEMGEAKPSVAAEPGGSNMGVGKVGKDSGH